MTISLQALADGISALISVSGQSRLKFNGDGTLEALTSPTPADLATKKLPTMDLFGFSSASSGWQKLPSGLIIQWGNSVINTTDTTTIFPTAFPNACFVVIPNCRNVSSFYSVRIGNIANANFVAAQNSATAQSLQWIAIGY